MAPPGSASAAIPHPGPGMKQAQGETHLYGQPTEAHSPVKPVGAPGLVGSTW